MAPKVAGIIFQIAVPASARPRLNFHWERPTAGHLPFRTKLVQHGLEGDLDRCRNLDLLGDLQRFERRSLTVRFHRHHFRGLRGVGDSVCSRARRSARTLMRSSCWLQSASKAFPQSCTVFSFSASRLYTRCLPCLVTATTPTLRSTPRCFETAGCGSPSVSTRTPTVKAPRCASSSRICRRRSSAMALNTSAVVGARGMLLLYSHNGICQAQTRDVLCLTAFQ